MKPVLYNVGVGLAVALLVCLLPMPYGYYMLIRFAATIVFGCMAYGFYKEGRLVYCVVACAVALLFQPFFKITLGRTLWNVVDVVVAVALFLLWIRNRRQGK